MARTRMRYFIPKLLLALVGLLALTAYFAPWKPLLEQQLVAALRAQGFTQAQLHVGRLGFSGITLNDFTLGDAFPLTFEEVTVGYSLADLKARQLHDITFHHLTYTPKDSGLRVTAGTAVITLAQQSDNRINGEWSLSDITLTDAPLLLPPLGGKGTFSIAGDTYTAQGSLKNAHGEYHGSFDLTYARADMAQSRVVLSDIEAPWNGGTLGVRRTVVALGRARDIALDLTVRHVSVAALMASLTGDRVKGTGTVLGSLPVVYRPDGTFLIANNSGTLKADAPGTLALAPEIIPGDNAQVGLVRDILKNLHYSVLSMGIENTADRRLRILLAVEGSNPELVPARPVKLNVQLNGDLLQLFTQSIMSLTDPKTLLEQE